MVDMGVVNNVLVYAVLGPDGEPRVTWPWTKAPKSIRKMYRRRPDFWAIAPTCVAREWMLPWRR